MISQIKANLLTNWHLGRALRLVFGTYAAIQGIINQDFLSGAIGALFLYQAFTNSGCCAGNACASTPMKDSVQQTDDVEFEEVSTTNNR